MHSHDHRHLARDLRAAMPTASARLDAIFVSTKDHPDDAVALVRQLIPLGRPVRVMASTVDDFPFLDAPANDLDVFLVRPSEFERGSPLLSHRFSSEAPRNAQWDLHHKRNAAVALPRTRGHERILLLDDDVRGVTPAVIATVEAALTVADVAGCFTNGALDNSVVAHTCRLLGIEQSTFLGGGCLGVNVVNEPSIFPPLYNEDWLFMLDALRRGAVAIAGNVEQLPTDPLAEMQRAPFQEPGEIVAEGCFAALAGDPDRMMTRDYWHGYLAARRQLLASLIEGLSMASDRSLVNLRHALVATSVVLESVLPADCVSYITLLHHENMRWRSMLDTAAHGERTLCDVISVRPRSRLAMAGPAGRARSVDQGVWHYDADSTVIIVCPQLPLEMRSCLADPDNRNHNPSQKLADLDAAIEIFGHVRSASPAAQIRICSAAELDGDLAAEHLIVVGGAAWNTASSWFCSALELPIRQVTAPAQEEYFTLDGVGDDREFRPNVVTTATGVSGHDIGFFARAPNPFRTDRTVTMFNGVLSFGVLGMVRAFANPAVGGANQDLVASRPASTPYCLFVRVPIYNSTVPAVDITAAENRLFEWSGPAAAVLQLQGHAAHPESASAPTDAPSIARAWRDREGGRQVESERNGEAQPS